MAEKRKKPLGLGARSGNKKGRSTAAEIMRRVECVFRLRLDGAELCDIRDFSNQPEQNWGVCDSTLKSYIKQADLKCKEYITEREYDVFSMALLRRTRLYNKAMRGDDLKTALAVAQDESKLLGLYPATKVAPTDPSGTREYNHGLTEVLLASLPLEVRKALLVALRKENQDAAEDS